MTLQEIFIIFNSDNQKYNNKLFHIQDIHFHILKNFQDNFG